MEPVEVSDDALLPLNTTDVSELMPAYENIPEEFKAFPPRTVRLRPNLDPVVDRIENGQRIPTLHGIKCLAEDQGYEYVHSDEDYHGGMIQVDLEDREVYVVGDPNVKQRLEFETRWSIDVR